MPLILHAADLHLDSPFRSLPAAEAVRRRRQQRQALEALRDLAQERRVDLALFPGDLFDAGETHPETVSLLSRTLGEFPCPVVIAPGNHDFWGDKSPYATQPWPGNVHILHSETVTALPFPELGVTVYGAAFLSPSRPDDPLAGFSAPGDGSIPLGVFHGAVGETGPYAPIAPGSLAGSGLRYVALGHIHRPSGLQWSGPTAWAYPGCAQGRGFDETGDKGALLVRVTDQTVELEFCPLPGPRYWALTAPVTGREPASVLLETLSAAGREDYVRVTFTGESRGLDLPALRALGDPLCRSLELRDGTVTPQDIWARAGEQTLTGLFLQEMARRLDAAADDAARRQVELAVRCGLAALEGREDPLC